MKIKRQKRVNRILNFFKNNFGHHEPYNMLIDGTFCNACLTTKINIKDQMPKYFGGEVKLLTTSCCIIETEKLGPALHGAAMILKQFAVYKCGHDPTSPKPAIKCFKSMLGTNNPNHYFIATQDIELRTRARKIPGTPILYLHGNSPTLEEPSESSHESADKSINKRMESSSYQSRILNKLKEETFGVQNETKKRKKKKGPNPLSCLKSKKNKKNDSLKGVQSNVPMKKKRIRNRKNKKVSSQ